MNEEIAKVISMVQEGKVDADEAAEIIAALKQNESPKETTGNYLDKTLKVRIQSKQRDDVKVNVPLRFVNALLRMGQGVASNIPNMNKYAGDIDMDLIIQAIDNEVSGKIVDIQTGDGELIAVYIE
ncbi:hypothetical protein CIL05_17935 [Virgibacillus profundi]|uniref:YvlB/LiaX N-terminal domain-containing protein n=1 Tax=Virgibacillus profundi TaxID=2024555 RepID=A0A2A2I9D3_9BACI|nr:hypothetical protein [Virgibacillus profundi]PAV28247.1 hypothetical protein CIL05_17935 [Virgibacillus profundi]PXY52552.1 hypothetical protein CIT14_17375 [Virgibacillus profundi]